MQLLLAVLRLLQYIIEVYLPARVEAALFNVFAAEDVHFTMIHASNVIAAPLGKFIRNLLKQ